MVALHNLTTAGTTFLDSLSNTMQMAKEKYLAKGCWLDLGSKRIPAHNHFACGRD
jgi:hypothetical protein